MIVGRRELPREFHELQNAYTLEKNDELRLRILQQMFDLIPPGIYQFNRVRAHTTQLMRFTRERIRHKKEALEAVTKSRLFFKDNLFSIALVGDANSGKTALLNRLCGTNHPSTFTPYETKEPVIGVFLHEGVKLRVVEVPSALTPRHAKILHESDLIVILPDSARYVDLVDSFGVETPVSILESFPLDDWSFLDLVVVKLHGEGLVLFSGTSLNDLDISEALVNGKKKKGSYKLKDADVIV